MDLFKGLNPQQQEAMTASLGPTLILAGPGSGKTRVLTQRIAYLVSYMGVRPYNILAVTFTNKAARQMGERVNELLEGETRGLSLGTFHAICAKLLRMEADVLPFDRNFVIYDSDDQRGVVRDVIKQLNLDDKSYPVHAVHNSISRAKNELISPDEYPLNTYRDEVVQRVYKKYQAQLLNSNALDFDDLLLYAYQMMEEHSAIREKYARRFEQVLVDEFQDTNMAQYLLLKHLCSFHQNIFVVGDIDQSIYRWRGADYRNVMRFERDYPELQTILLEQNYRSTQNILDAAMSVIVKNTHRKHKELFTERGRGEKIVLQECFDGREEGTFVVETIGRRVAKGAQPGDFAIMYRTNAQSRLLEEAFIRRGLPYKLVGAQRFYGRKEIKDILAYLRVVHNPADETSLLRVVNTPRRKIGNKALLALRTLAAREEKNLSSILLAMGQAENNAYFEFFNTSQSKALSTFGGQLGSWKQAAEELSPLTLMDLILSAIDYQSYLEDGTPEGQERWENIMEFRRLASEYEARSLTAFLEDVALVSDQDTVDNDANVPTLLTLHAAKGLEFPTVFITGLEDGTLPHVRSFDDPEGIDEERRLLYVGITRAKDRLYLVHALNRSTFGYSELTEASRFLADIPEELCHGSLPPGVRVSTRQRVYQAQSTWDSKQQHAPIMQAKFHPGQNVRHGTYGEGMVLNVNIEDGEEIVDVFFGEEASSKRLIASLAGLEILGD